MIHFTPQFSTTTIWLPTYPYSRHLKTAYNPTYNMTYPVLDWDSYYAAPGPASEPISVPYTLLVLENPYLKVTILPELGGRVYQIIHKATGNNVLYQNPVIKPTRWGPVEQGWWLAVGGIEWGLPVDEHGYEWGIPWSWTAITSSRGVTVTVWDTEAVDRLRARIDLFLPGDRAYLAVTPHLENPTAQAIDYKFWLNASLTPGPDNKSSSDLTFIFNTDEVTVHSTGDPRLREAYPGDLTGPDYQISWPVYNGVNYSKLGNWGGWLGFFEYPQAGSDFIGVYDPAFEEGVARVFPPEIAIGTKGFGTGWGEASIPWSNWTDEDSGGVELHGGPAPTFWDTATLTASTTLSWTEHWYPVGAIGAFSTATEEAALGVQWQEAVPSMDGTPSANGALSIKIHTTRYWRAGETALYIWDRDTCQLLTDHLLPSVYPGHPYTLTVEPPDGRDLEHLAIRYTDADANTLASLNPSGCAIPPLLTPAPHLHYGMNVRDPEIAPSLLDPLEFDWIKLWEEYNGTSDTFGTPTERLPYHVLFILDCRSYVEHSDLGAWGNHVEAIAQAGKGFVEAYEICNEPNVRPFWNGAPPDPKRFADMLCIAHQRIRVVDPEALIISGGLAPVGRVEGHYLEWQNHDGDKMDERTYLEGMLDNGAGMCIDGFGYHPYGFAYPPEQDPDTVVNGFTFRSVETMRDILVTHGFETMPIWATEFNWLRNPAEDGVDCSRDAEYQQYFDWMEVSAQQQADYLVRAFEYADRYWPWMAGMFAWNLDWYNYLEEGSCGASRYFSIRWDNGSWLGGTRPAYNALATMEKRPREFAPEEQVPVLWIHPQQRLYLLDVDELATVTTLTHTISISNVGESQLRWTAQMIPNGSFTPTLPVTQGIQGEYLQVVVDTTELKRGFNISESVTMPLSVVYTGSVLITATSVTTPSYVIDSPQRASFTLRIVRERFDIFLPLILRNSKGGAEQPDGPHGPSKIGLHTIGGGVTEFVREVKEGGGHVAVVKGVSDFGFLERVKEISPETVTIGRWADPQWEAIDAQGDPAERATDYMAEHMPHWEPHRAYVDYWEVLNEPDPPTPAQHAWLAQFFIAAMNIAEANGYKLALFSYSTGVPEWYEWEAIVETGLFARAKIGGHILSLHEYAEPTMSAGWGEPMPQYPGQPIDERPRYPDRGIYTGRYRHLYEDFLIPRGEVIPLAITECNLAIDDPEIRDPIFVEEMIWYDDKLREDDYVIGMTIFTLGGGSWSHFDFQDFLPELRNHILRLRSE
jgi:hypothetical protein